MLSKVRGDTAKQGTHLFAVMTLEFGTPSKKTKKHCHVGGDGKEM